MALGFMHIRELTEEREQQSLHDLAAKSSQTRGRVKAETLCNIRTAYQRDRDRILHSKAFRRLKHKTQMFIAPLGDHYRTRLTHTLEVAQVSRTIARALRLNEDLTESIALGHDLGHPPFGHTGEHILHELSNTGFHHQEQGLRIVTQLEPLNLTTEVLDGMEGLTPQKAHFLTLEAQIVDIADRMAYLHHDVEDARRAGIMQESDLPEGILSALGKTRQTRLDCMVSDMIYTSLATLNTESPQIALSPPVWEALMSLRQWMFDHIYLAPERQEQTDNARRVLTALYQFYLKHPEYLSQTQPDRLSEKPPLERQVIDYLSGMTDRFALEAYKAHLLPNTYRAFSVNPRCEEVAS